MDTAYARTLIHFQHIELNSNLSSYSPLLASHLWQEIVATVPTVECCNSWKAVGKLCTVYYLTQLPVSSIHAAIRAKDLSALSPSRTLIHCTIWLRFTTKGVYSKLFLPLLLFFISSSPWIPFSPHCDLYYGISLCFVCFLMTPFISQSVWPPIIFKVDPNAFPGTCQRALPVSLRHKSNI